MKRKLNVPLIGLLETLGKISLAAKGKIVKWGFTARETADRLKQAPADPNKKARRKMVGASRRRNRR